MGSLQGRAVGVGAADGCVGVEGALALIISGGIFAPPGRVEGAVISCVFSDSLPATLGKLPQAQQDWSLLCVSVRDSPHFV